MDCQVEWKASGEVDQGYGHHGRAEFLCQGKLPRLDLSESVQSGEICRAEHRPDDRGSRLQRRLRHAALGRLRDRQGQGRCRGAGYVDRGPVRRELEVAVIETMHRTLFLLVASVFIPGSAFATW